jgi:hypothetical protein
MHLEAAKRYEVASLSVGDVDEIFALYTLGRSGTPYGFLAIRTKNDFCKILAQPEDVIATGIRHNGRLIAYSICHRLTKNPYPKHPVLSLIDAAKSTLYHGDGTVVHPAYQGRMLAQRISRLRWRQILERQIDHVLGLIAVDNIASIGNAVLAGVLLVGFRRDETSLNYIAYAGRFRDQLRTDIVPTAVGWKNHQQQQRLFSEGKVVRDVTHSSDLSAAATKLERQFAFVPWISPGG